MAPLAFPVMFKFIVQAQSQPGDTAGGRVGSSCTFLMSRKGGPFTQDQSVDFLKYELPVSHSTIKNNERRNVVEARLTLVLWCQFQSRSRSQISECQASQFLTRLTLAHVRLNKHRPQCRRRRLKPEALLVVPAICGENTHANGIQSVHYPQEFM